MSRSLHKPDASIVPDDSIKPGASIVQDDSIMQDASIMRDASLMPDESIMPDDRPIGVGERFLRRIFPARKRLGGHRVL